MKHNRFLFPLLISLAGLFMVISGLVVYKVHTLQSYVKMHVDVISFSSEIQENTHQLLSDFDFYAVNSTNQGVVQLAEKSIMDSKKLNLNEITETLKRIQELAEVNISGHNTKKIQKELFNLEGACNKIIKTKRTKISTASIELKQYWRFTYALIGAACILAILLSIAAIRVFQAKEQILELQKMKTLLLNESLDVVVTCDDKGRIVEFNNAAARIFGYSFDEVFRKKVQILYANKEQSERVKEAINLHEKFEGEILNRKKNGEIFLSKLSANRLLNEKGEPIGSMGVSRDITKEKAMATNFESIVNNVADIVYSCDVQGNFTFVNKAIVEMLGYSENELIGKPFFEIIHKDHVNRVRDKYVKQFRDKDPVSYTSFQVQKKEGSFIWISQSVRLVMSETHKGHVVGMHGIARNVEGLKELPQIQA